MLSLVPEESSHDPTLAIDSEWQRLLGVRRIKQGVDCAVPALLSLEVSLNVHTSNRGHSNHVAFVFGVGVFQFWMNWWPVVTAPGIPATTISEG